MQVREPLQEAEDRAAIPALTPIDDDVSMAVMRQYDENPYPRWTINPFIVRAADRKRQLRTVGDDARGSEDVLIAGCGTGQHPFSNAQYAPQSRILAVDISRTALAYARRKTREEGLCNIDYAQADILKLRIHRPHLRPHRGRRRAASLGRSESRMARPALVVGAARHHAHRPLQCNRAARSR